MTDEYFYVVKELGVTKHIHHQKLDAQQINFPSRLLKEAERELLTDIGRADTSAKVGVNTIYAKTGKLLTASNVRYLQGLHHTNYYLSINSHHDTMN